MGNITQFAKEFEQDVLIVQFAIREFELSPDLKLSIHSGSDKFSIYPIIGKLVGDLLHLKTSGTSYLESLRLIARRNPDLFREIVKYSLSCFEADRRTYHVSADVSNIPDPANVSDEDLEKIFLNERDGRQLLHVTFGSILTAKTRDGKWLFRDRIRRILIENEEEYYQIIESHLGRHIKALGLTAGG